MQRHVSRSILLTSLVLLCVTSASSQDHRQRMREMLVGIEVVRVVVEDLTADVAEFGLSEDRLLTLTELRLRQSGIPMSPDAIPFVYVNVNVLTLDHNRGCAATVVLKVLAPVQLIHSSKMARVALWEEIKLILDSQSSCRRHIQDSLGEMLDVFVNDYLAANPR